MLGFFMARPRQLVKSKFLLLTLTEVSRYTHGRHARTFPARLPVPRRPSWGQWSDHAPLAADLELELEERP